MNRAQTYALIINDDFRPFSNTFCRFCFENFFLEKKAISVRFYSQGSKQVIGIGDLESEIVFKFIPFPKFRTKMRFLAAVGLAIFSRKIVKDG